jgi:hypothetical protein
MRSLPGRCRSTDDEPGLKGVSGHGFQVGLPTQQIERNTD